MPKASVSHLARDTSGGTTMLLALLAIPVIGMTGFSIDMVRASNAKSALRAALDASLLSAAHEGAATFSSTANTYFGLNTSSLADHQPAASFAAEKNGRAMVYTGTASADIRTTFAAILGINSIPLSMSASVTRPANEGENCIYVLDDDANHALTFNAEATVIAPDCSIQVHSRNTAAASFSSNINIQFASICVAGEGVTNNYGPIQNLHTSCQAEPEPFAATLPAVSPGDCDYGSKNYNGGDITMHPGTYCGNINFNGEPHIDFIPGLYVLNGSNWNVNGGEWSGDGVSFYFHNKQSGIQFNSAVKSALKPPGSGPYKDIMFFEPPGLDKSNFIFNDSEDFEIGGLVYLPSRNTTYNANSIWRARKFTFVVNTLKLNQTNWDLTPGVESATDAGNQSSDLRILN